MDIKWGLFSSSFRKNNTAQCQDIQSLKVSEFQKDQKNDRKKFNLTTMIPQVDLFSFVFWKNLQTPKRHFEINWPLQNNNMFSPLFYTKFYDFSMDLSTYLSTSSIFFFFSKIIFRLLQGYRSGFVYKQPLVRDEPPKPKSDVELPAAVSSLGFLLEEQNLYKDG